MIAHGGWYLEQHVKEPDVRFNILYGHYDYVVLQEHAHPFGPEEKFFEAARMLSQWIREAGSKPVLYMTWAKKEEEHEQAHMTEVHKAVAEGKRRFARSGGRKLVGLHAKLAADRNVL